MAKADGGELIARVMRENRVKYCFAINGGHTFPILGQSAQQRRQADPHAPRTGHGLCRRRLRAHHGDARRLQRHRRLRTDQRRHRTVRRRTDRQRRGVHRRPASHHRGRPRLVPGGLRRRGLPRSPSSAKRVLDWSTIAVRPAPGVSRGASRRRRAWRWSRFRTNILYHQDEDAGQRRRARASLRTRRAARARRSARRSSAPVELLVAARAAADRRRRRRVLVRAAAELRELAELTRHPGLRRRAGQGVVPEDHPLAVRGAWKKPFTGRADVVLAVGFRFWSGEHFGQPPTWNDKATYIQIDATPTRIGWQVPRRRADRRRSEARAAPADQARQGSSSSTSSKNKTSPGSSRSAHAPRHLRARCSTSGTPRSRENRPIHPDRLARDLVSVLDRDATVVIDTFTLSGWMSRWLTARFPGQVVDAGPLAPVGHGIGMAIGAQLARPGKQVVVVIGDGGLGIGGWDIETARATSCRSSPCCGTTAPGVRASSRCRCSRAAPIRSTCCRTSATTRCSPRWAATPSTSRADEQIAPALERAFDSGKPSLVNVIGDKRIGHPRLGGNLLGSTGSN